MKSRGLYPNGGLITPKEVNRLRICLLIHQYRVKFWPNIASACKFSKKINHFLRNSKTQKYVTNHNSSKQNMVITCLMFIVGYQNVNFALVIG